MLQSDIPEYIFVCHYKKDKKVLIQNSLFFALCILYTNLLSSEVPIKPINNKGSQ